MEKFYGRLRVNLIVEEKEGGEFYAVLRRSDGAVAAKGFTGRYLNLRRLLKHGEAAYLSIYSLDSSWRFNEGLHGPLRSLIISGGGALRITVAGEEVEVKVPAEEKSRGLKVKFKDALRFIKGLKAEAYSRGERRPSYSATSFSEYLGWGDPEGAKALFGGTPLLYEHQDRALRLLEEAGSRRLCLILASGMASGKTEVAVLYLLRKMREGALGGRPIIVYPTRELLRNQYGRWKMYLYGAYDLGYLSGPVEAAVVYGTQPDAERKAESRKLSAEQCVVLTTASTLFSWANRLDREVGGSPAALVLDEVHFYNAYDLTLIMMLLKFILRKHKQLSKIIMLSATAGGLREFEDSVKGFLQIDATAVEGESLQGRKTIYAVDLTGLPDNYCEARISEVLSYYASKGFGDKTIIFARDRGEAESYYNKIRSREFGKAACLHLGDMDEYERRRAVSGFMAGEKSVIITVKTLEVGVDIGDASRIIHLGLPPSLNEFMQREGRAGRRGQESESIVFLRDKNEAARFRRWVEAAGYEPAEI